MDALQNRFAGLLTQVTAFMGAGGAESVEAMITKLEQLKGLIDQVHNQIRNPEKTTFVCVCIPEFLSIYETERLVQELSKSEIDTHNVVVNQVLFPDKDAEDLVEWYAGAKATLPQEAQDLIGKTIARKRMQDRYISQIFELYEDFHVILMPLLDNEVSMHHVVSCRFAMKKRREQRLTFISSISSVRCRGSNMSMNDLLDYLRPEIIFSLNCPFLHIQVRGVASLESFSTLLLNPEN